MGGQNEVHKVKEEEMIDLTAFAADYLKMLKRTWKMVLVLGIIGALVSGLWVNMTYQPRYTASATFTINIYEEQEDGTYTNSSFFDNSAAEQMATTFPHILTSGVLQRKVAKELSVDAVPGRIKASVVENTNLLTLSVTDTDAERAYRTLRAVVNNYPSVSELIVGKVNMEMLDETGIPAHATTEGCEKKRSRGGTAGIGADFCWLHYWHLLTGRFGEKRTV